MSRNAVLIMHGTGGDGHQFFRPQFADVLFKPGGLLDPAKYYIILPDDIGHGKSSKPSDGMHARFPHYDYHDMVVAEHALVTKGLDVDHLRVVMGTSMGCMHSFMWGEMYPNAMDGLLPLACLPVQISGRNRLWRKMILDGIRKDPAWKGGEYTHEPVMALRIAADMLRIAGSAPLQDQKNLPTAEGGRCLSGKFTRHELDTLDANDLLYQVDSSRDYDPSAGLGKIKAAGDLDQFGRRFHQSARTGHRRARGEEDPPWPLCADPHQRQDPWPRHPHLGGGLAVPPGRLLRETRPPARNRSLWGAQLPRYCRYHAVISRRDRWVVPG